jgi:hypothetical protein
LNEIEAPIDRVQGYRLHISATGNRALQACLPAENFEHFVRASAIGNTAVTFLDHRLNRLLQIASHQPIEAPLKASGPLAGFRYVRSF